MLPSSGKIGFSWRTTLHYRYIALQHPSQHEYKTFKKFNTNTIADQQAKYILAQQDVVQCTVAAMGSAEFVDRHPNSTNLILFDRLFDELKTVLI
jgi:hypothetical protein